MVDKCIFHTNAQSITQKRMIPSVQIWCRNDHRISYKWNGFGLKGQRSRLGLALIATRRGFELYECLLVFILFPYSVLQCTMYSRRTSDDANLCSESTRDELRSSGSSSGNTTVDAVTRRIQIGQTDAILHGLVLGVDRQILINRTYVNYSLTDTRCRFAADRDRVQSSILCFWPVSRLIRKLNIFTHDK